MPARAHDTGDGLLVVPSGEQIVSQLCASQDRDLRCVRIAARGISGRWNCANRLMRLKFAAVRGRAQGVRLELNRGAAADRGAPCLCVGRTPGPNVGHALDIQPDSTIARAPAMAAACAPRGRQFSSSSPSERLRPASFRINSMAARRVSSGSALSAPARMSAAS